jgi:hypothetical protein
MTGSCSVVVLLLRGGTRSSVALGIFTSLTNWTGLQFLFRDVPRKCISDQLPVKTDVKPHILWGKVSSSVN